MKKVLLLVILSISVLNSYAQSLNSSAKNLKNNNVDIYNAIKYKAQEDFPNDYSTTLYVINQQAKAYYELAALSHQSNFDNKIYTEALNMFSEPSSKGNARYNDWTTILYYYKQQIKAKNAF